MSEHEEPQHITQLSQVYFERAGRKLKTDLAHPSIRSFFSNNSHFVVSTDDKDLSKQFYLSLAKTGGGSRNRSFSSGEPLEDEDEYEEGFSSGSALPPPNVLPEGASWSRVAAGEKVAKPKADQQKQLSPRLDTDDKSSFPPLGSSATGIPTSGSHKSAPSQTSAASAAAAADLSRGDEDVFKPIVATAAECAQACLMLKESKELAVLVKSAVGHEDKLSLVQVASSEFVFLFDMLSEAAGQFKEKGLSALLENASVRLLVCDAATTVRAMRKAHFEPKDVLDVRLLYSELLGQAGDLGELILLVQQDSSESVAWTKKQARYWMNRPLSAEQRELASLEATSLFDAMQKLQDKARPELVDAVLARSLKTLGDRRSGDRAPERDGKKSIQRFISAPLAKANVAQSASVASAAAPTAAAAVASSASAPAPSPAPAAAAPTPNVVVTKILTKDPASAQAVPQKPHAQQQPQAQAQAQAQQQQKHHQHHSNNNNNNSNSGSNGHQSNGSAAAAASSPAVVHAAPSPVPSQQGRFLNASPLNIGSPSSGSASPRARPTADHNTDFSSIFAVLPAAISQALGDRMPDYLSALHSIAIDLGQPVTLTRLYQEPPVRLLLLEVVSEQDLKSICDNIGGPLSSRGSATIGDSLHICHAIVDPATGAITGVTIRIGRAVLGASDVLHDIVLSGKNIVLLGFGKTTLLRDAVARRALTEQSVVMVIDTKGEMGGLRSVAHASLGHVRRIVPGAESQTAAVRAAVERHSAKVLAIDELWATEDFAELRNNARVRGVQVIAGCPARDLAEFQALRPGADFDTVVEALSPVSYRVSYLAANTTQLRMRTPQGVVIRDE